MATNNSVNTSLAGQTGTGTFVGATSPTLVTPALGTPSSGTLTNCTGLPAASGISGLGTGVATALAANVNGSGAISLTTSPTLITPVLGAASATSVAFSSTSGIIGTTTNDNAAAGSVGEFLNSSIASSPGVNIPTATPTNITSIVLTAGDWDVWGNINYVPSATIIAVASIIFTTSASLPADGKDYSVEAAVAYTVISLNAVSQRISVAAPTTVYLIGYAVLSVGTCVAGGNLNARRRR